MGCHWLDSCRRRNTCVDARACLSVADTQRCDCPECVRTRDSSAGTAVVAPTATPSPLLGEPTPTVGELLGRVRFTSVSIPLLVQEAGAVRTNNFTLYLLPTSAPTYAVNPFTGMLHGPLLPARGVELLVNVTSPPSHGRLRLADDAVTALSTPLRRLETFFYRKLSRQGVVYSHDGSEMPRSDEFVFSLHTADGDVLVDSTRVKVTIQPVNDFPRQVNLSAISIAVGSRLYLTSGRLAFVDDDGAASTTRYEWINTSRTLLPARLEHVLNPGSPLSHFTQEDVDLRRVVIVHLGQRRNDAFTFEFRVADELGAARTFSMSVQPFVGSIHLDRNAGVQIVYHRSTNISRNQLFASTSFDFQSPQPPVTYVVHDHPGSAVLALRDAETRRLSALTSFTQADVDAGRVVLVHNTSTSLAQDSFVFSLASAGFASADRHRVNITISLPPRSVRPKIVVHAKPFSIGEGKLKPMSPNLITVSLDPASASRGPFKVRITSSVHVNQGRFMRRPRPEWPQSPVTVFRLSDLHRGLISFIHLDGESPPSTIITFCVSPLGDWPPDVYKPDRSCGHRLRMTVRLHNDEEPVLVYKPPRQVELAEGSWRVIDNATLLVTDKDTLPLRLAFTVTTTPSNGYLALLPNATVPVTRFTQQDINTRRLIYRHRRGARLIDSFYFSVKDAEAARGSADAVQPIMISPLEITVDASHQAPLRLSAMSSLTGAIVAPLTDATFALSTNDAEQTPDVRLTIATRPQHGFVEWSETSAAASQFTVADVRAGRVHYRLADRFVHSEVDSFECVATIGRSRLGRVQVQIELEVRPSIGATVSDRLLVEMGNMATMTTDDIVVAYDPSQLTARQVRVVIAAPPVHGRILVDGRPADEFSLLDLQSDRVAFRADSTSSANDSFSLYVTNGQRNTSLMTLHVVLFDGRIRLAVHGIVVEEGGRTVVSSAALSATGPPQHDLVFSVDVGPHRGQLRFSHAGLGNVSVRTFTAADVEHGYVLYSHDGSELASDYFNFSVTLRQRVDSAAARRIGAFADTVAGQLRIRVTRKNDNKPQSANPDGAGTVDVMQFGDVLLTEHHLNYTDGDTDIDSGELLYTVYSGLRHGALYLRNVSVRQFRQRDLRREGVLYRHRGAADDLLDLMRFYVSDENPANHQYDLLGFRILPMSLRVNGTILHVIEGNHRILTAEHLTVVSNLEPLDADEALFVISSAPSHGTLHVDGQAVAGGGNFSLRAVLAGLVLYAHDGSDTVRDAMAVTPRYRSRAFARHTVKVMVHAVDDTPPSLVALGNLLVHEEATAVVTASVLAARDDRSDDVTFSMTRQPTSGVLLQGGRVTHNFTQAQVDAGEVEYRHLTGHPLHDHLVVAVSDGSNVLRGVRLNISVYPTTIPLLSPTPFVVAEGGSARLDAAVVQVTNELYAAEELAFRITEAPRHGDIVDTGGPIRAFNSSHLRTGDLWYVHDGSETLNDSFVLVTRHAGKRSKPLRINVTVTPVNDQPPLRVNVHLLVVWRYHEYVVTPEKLLFTDVDTASSELVYSLDPDTPNALGILVSRRAGNGRALETFSQQDVSDGDVVFVSNNQTGASSFIFKLTDGVEEHLEFAELRVQVRQLSLEARVRRNASVLVSGNVTLDPLTLDVSRNDGDQTGLPNVVLSILRAADSLKYGYVTVSGQRADVFTYAELLGEKVAYVQNSTLQWPPNDWIVLSAGSTADVQGVASIRVRVAIRYRTAPNSRLHANSVLRVDEGAAALVTSSQLNAGNLAARLAHDLPVPLGSVVVVYRPVTDARHGRYRHARTGAPLQSFTQADVDSEQVEYVHDGSESHRDRTLFDVVVSDKEDNVLSHVQETLRIRIKPLNRHPVEIDGESSVLRVSVGGTMPVPAAGFINVIDRDRPPEELHYTFSPSPAGSFNVRGDPDSELNFTQSHLDAGLVEFVAGGEAGDYFLACIASDGRHSLSLGLRLEIKEGFLELAPGQPLVMNQMVHTVYLSGANFDLRSNVHPADLLFMVDAAPSRGTLHVKSAEPDAALASTDTFSWKDVVDGRVAYRMDDFTESEDMFTVQEIGSFNLTVDVRLHVEAVIVTPSERIVFSAGVPMVLSRDMLNADQLASSKNYKSVGFELTAPPKRGSIRVRADNRRRRRATSEFTYDDVVAGRVLYEPKADAPARYDESFEFLVDAPGVPPGRGSLAFSVRPAPPTPPPRTDAPQPSGRTGAPASTGTPPDTKDLPAMKSEQDDEYLMQVIIPAAGGGFFVALLLLTLVIVAYRGKKRREHKGSHQNNYAAARGGGGHDSPTSETSSAMSAQKNGTLRDDSILVQATPVSDMSGKLYTTSMASSGGDAGGDDDSGLPGESPGVMVVVKPAHPATLPRSWNSSAGHAVVAGRSNSDQEMANYGRGPGSTTPTEAFSGTRPSALPPNSRNGSTSHYYKVSREDSLRYNDGRGGGTQAGGQEHVNSHESLAAYDRVFDKILDKRPEESPVQHDGRPSSAMTVLRKNEYWI